jgi:hypothetical protein
MYNLLRKLKFYEILLRIFKAKNKKQSKNNAVLLLAAIPDHKLVAYAQRICNSLLSNSELRKLPVSLTELQESINQLSELQMQVSGSESTPMTRRTLGYANQVVRHHLMLIGNVCEVTIENAGVLKSTGTALRMKPAPAVKLKRRKKATVASTK